MYVPAATHVRPLQSPTALRRHNTRTDVYQLYSLLVYSSEGNTRSFYHCAHPSSVVNTPLQTVLEPHPPRGKERRKGEKKELV